jgi:hypothetical protein
MSKRKPLSKKTRFEVFKRDSFTCQYCGAKAPDVLLEVDHIDPVASGGCNDIINLITSCKACNSGKSKNKLSDDSAIIKQRKQLEERREQLEMLMQWSQGLQDLKSSQVDQVVDYINKAIPGFSVMESYKATIKTWIKKYPFDLIFEAIDESASRYLRYDDDMITKESAEDFLKKIGGILYFKAQPPLEQKMAWIRTVASKTYHREGWQFKASLQDYVNALKNAGWDEASIIDDLQNEVRNLINKKYSANSFLNALDEWTASIKNWGDEKEES